MIQSSLDFGFTAPPPSRDGHVYFCFKPPLIIADQATVLAEGLQAEGVIDTIRPPDKLHVSIVSAGPFQNLQAIASKAREVADGMRGNRFTFEFSQVLPFGGPTAVLSPIHTPKEAKELQMALALGIQRPEFRPAIGLSAHMTISYTNTPIAPRTLPQAIVWPVTEFFLVISRPKIGLETLGRWDLT